MSRFRWRPFIICIKGMDYSVTILIDSQITYCSKVNHSLCCSWILILSYMYLCIYLFIYFFFFRYTTTDYTFNPVRNLNDLFTSIDTSDSEHLKVFLRVRPSLPEENVESEVCFQFVLKF